MRTQPRRYSGAIRHLGWGRAVTPLCPPALSRLLGELIYQFCAVESRRRSRSSLFLQGLLRHD